MWIEPIEHLGLITAFFMLVVWPWLWFMKKRGERAASPVKKNGVAAQTVGTSLIVEYLALTSLVVGDTQFCSGARGFIRRAADTRETKP